MSPVAEIYVRAALTLHWEAYARDAAFRDIADIMGVSVATVRDWAWQVRAREKNAAKHIRQNLDRFPKRRNPVWPPAPNSSAAAQHP